MKALTLLIVGVAWYEVSRIITNLPGRYRFLAVGFLGLWDSGIAIELHTGCMK
jgi:hypothetical protein